MKTKPLLALAIVLSLFVAIPLIAPPQTANAQGSPDITFDFTIDDQGWVAYTDPQLRATYVAGVGWHRSIERDDRVTISYLSTLTDVTQIRIYLADCTGVTNIGLNGGEYIACTGDYAEWSFTATTFTAIGFDVAFPNTYDPYVVKVEVWQGGPTPTPTFTPSITPTPTITPTAELPAWGRSCLLIGQANANFTAGNVWAHSAPVTTPSGSSIGILLPGAGDVSTLAIKLSPTAQYKVQMSYHLDSVPGGLGTISLKVGVGIGQDHYAPIAHVETQQDFEFGPVNFAPSSDGFYNAVISWDGTTPDPGVIVDWFCVVQYSSGTTPVDNSSGESTGRCESCDRVATGDFISDLFAAIGWLWCAFRQLFDCVLISIIYGAWTTIRHLLGFIANIQVWAGLGIQAFNTWILSLLAGVVYWLGGWIGNIINPLFSWLGNLVRSLGSIADFLRALLGSSAATERIIEFFESTIRGVNDLLYMAQLLITGYTTGVNSTTTIATQYAPQCFTPGSILYYPCLGFYVAENTILEGPVWYLIPFVMGIISWNVGFWALRQVTKTLSQN